MLPFCLLVLSWQPPIELPSLVESDCDYAVVLWVGSDVCLPCVRKAAAGISDLQERHPRIRAVCVYDGLNEHLIKGFRRSGLMRFSDCLVPEVNETTLALVSQNTRNILVGSTDQTAFMTTLEEIKSILDRGIGFDAAESHEAASPNSYRDGPT